MRPAWLKLASLAEKNMTATLIYVWEVVRCGEGVVYLMSPRRPADIGLQLGKACYPCSRQG